MENDKPKNDKQTYLQLLRDKKISYVDKIILRYERRRRVFSFCFRISGTLVILGSVALPYLVNGEVSKERLLITSFVALSVAALTALNSFYSWHRAWQKHMMAIIALRHHQANWEIDMHKASTEELDKAKADAYFATSNLFKHVFSIVREESEAFFADIKQPSIEPPKTT